MTWTRFMDMHSGGGRKLAWEFIFIEAPEAEARVVFYHRFGRNPDRVSCTCCGNDYSVDESATLEAATAYDRGLRYVDGIRNPNYKWGKGNPTELPWTAEGFYLEPGQPVPEGRTLSPSFRKGEGVSLPDFLAAGETPSGEPFTVIAAAAIDPKERTGTVPEQGYVWRD